MYGKVYLAGPITGLGYNEAQGWRDWVSKELEEWDIEAYSPLRTKKFLSKVPVIVGHDSKLYEPETALQAAVSSPSGVLGRDHNDCVTADVLFVNLVGATSPSLGTAMEIAWAYEAHIPIVLVIEDVEDTRRNPNEHIMFQAAATYRVPEIGAGVELTKAIILP